MTALVYEMLSMSQPWIAAFAWVNSFNLTALWGKYSYFICINKETEASKTKSLRAHMRQSQNMNPGGLVDVSQKQPQARTTWHYGGEGTWGWSNKPQFVDENTEAKNETYSLPGHTLNLEKPMNIKNIYIYSA